MNIKKLEAVVEAILFSMGEAVEIERLAAAVDHDEDFVCFFFCCLLFLFVVVVFVPVVYKAGNV